MADFSIPKLECDIVMKGGITSGVVYPLTVVELSRKYRLRNIGGTSAGALAAAITAAAEHGRARGGFDKIALIPDEVAQKLLGFFQPVPGLKPVFDALLALIARRSLGHRLFHAIGAIMAGYWPWTLAGLVPGLLVLGVMACGLQRPASAGEWALGGLVCLVGLVAALGFRLGRVVSTDLPANDFGLCTAKQIGAGTQEGLTDWLERKIDEVAGRSGGDPVTFRDLQGPDENAPRIRLEMMTTNLSMQRAHRLPLRTRIYFFRRSEFERLFSKRVVDYMVRIADPAIDRPDGYYPMPQMELPLVVAARMSLSFPGLICTVPLHARDYTLDDATAKVQLRRCLFSDGGITSNFPIHFFDKLLPCAPTFAVSLDAWRKEQHGDKRVHLPDNPRSGIVMPVRSIDSLAAFLMSIVDSAKGWQDNLQSTLPGYRERIVHVALDDETEGGMNLTMDKRTIDRLVGLGQDAGVELVENFDLDEHRWRRFLVAMGRLEKTLGGMQVAYESGDASGESFAAFLERYAPNARHYDQGKRTAEALARTAELMALAKRWRASPTFLPDGIPKPGSDLRITPRY